MSWLSELFGGGGGGGGLQTIPQTKEATEARKRLFALAGGEPPDIPLQKIAPLPEMTEERGLARETAKEMIQPQDIFGLPEVQGIIQEATMQGDLLANRLGRMLQSSGNLTTTSGRDVLGRAVTDVQKNLASSLAPFAMEERGRRRGLIPELERLGLTEEERARGVSQAELDASFQQEYGESKQLETFTIPLLKSIIGLQPGMMMMPEQKSMLSQLSPLIGDVLKGTMGGGGAGGTIGSIAGIGQGIAGLSTSAAAAAGPLEALMYVLGFSDARLKENFARIEDSLEKVNHLEGITYNFKGQENRTAGLIAQEVEKVLPEAVIEKEGVKLVRFDAVLALVVNALKELNHKFEEFQNGTANS